VNALFSPAGLVGAFVGGTVGWINYRIVTGIVTQKLRELDRSATDAERTEFERKLRLMHRILLVGTVPVTAGVGYWLGRTLGG
jgi:hypothetical protein